MVGTTSGYKNGKLQGEWISYDSNGLKQPWQRMIMVRSGKWFLERYCFK
jgi:antitoxin component YwqK of YwqJK toxin-antitoxin module